MGRALSYWRRRYGASMSGKCSAQWPRRASRTHVRSVALAVIRHRIVLNFQGEAEGVTVEQLIRLEE